MTKSIKEQLEERAAAQPERIAAPPEQRLEVFRMDHRARIPIRANPSDIGWDVYAFCLTESGRETSRQIPRYAAVAIDTKLVVRPPPGCFIQCCSRSGWALQGVFVANAPGIIDPEYVGELKVILYNGSAETKFISHNQRIAQLIVCPIVRAEAYEIVDQPTSEGRGIKGFGSSGL
jgi:dUTP pyrophosphatase